MMMMNVFIIVANGIIEERFVWNYEWTSGFMEGKLLGNYLVKMFKQRTMLILTFFCYLCSIVVPSLGRVDFRVKSCIIIKRQVAIALFCLGSGNTLQICGEVYGVNENITSIIVRLLCNY
jgi:hypothetical protein